MKIENYMRRHSFRSAPVFEDAREEDAAYMAIALTLARRAASEGEVPVGAVIVREGQIIASAYNRCEKSKRPGSHAEFESIEKACLVKGDWRLHDCTLYVTLEPCAMCAGAAINAHLGRVVYGTGSSGSGAFGTVINLSSYPLGWKPRLTRGVREAECALLLREFFSSLRHSSDSLP